MERNDQDSQLQDQDYQLQIVFERETAQAMQAEHLEKCKLLEEYVFLGSRCDHGS